MLMHPKSAHSYSQTSEPENGAPRATRNTGYVQSERWLTRLDISAALSTRSL